MGTWDGGVWLPGGLWVCASGSPGRVFSGECTSGLGGTRRLGVGPLEIGVHLGLLGRGVGNLPHGRRVAGHHLTRFQGRVISLKFCMNDLAGPPRAMVTTWGMGHQVRVLPVSGGLGETRTGMGHH